MNIFDKIRQLLKYCGRYEGHSCMMDERNDKEFNIVLPEEKEIRENISQLRLILLTGEAGDGKSRLLRNLEEELTKYNFQICGDFSEIDEQRKIEIINKIKQIVEGTSREKFIIAANVGIFTKTVLKEQAGLLDKINRAGDIVRIINFEKRNLASDRESFYEIIRAFLNYDSASLCRKEECPHREHCVFRDNLDLLRTEKGMESIRVLCDAIYLTGGHITFRELLSLASYMVTFGEDCGMRNAAGDQEEYRYYQIFKKTEDNLLNKVHRFDPSKKRINNGSFYSDREACIANKRKAFFDEGTDKKYELLFADYLPEFRRVLKYINGTRPYYFNSETDDNEILHRLKSGLSKITKAGQTDVSMTIVDTPTIFDNNIQTEFCLESDVETVWNRFDVDFSNIQAELADRVFCNRFYLSYIYQQGGEGKLRAESMLIDYELFCYLLMADEDFYLNRSSLSVEEYSINTFYRKVLRTRTEAYNKVFVKFNEPDRSDVVNFSLELKKNNSLLFGSQKIIKIRKEG